MSVDVFSVANRCALLRMPEPPFCMPGSTADILGSYAPTPGVGLARSLPRCADDERKADDGIAEPSDSSFLARYVPGPGVSSPMMSSFISRADAPPKPPEPARFERPKERAESAARSCVAKGSYAPGSPVAASTSPRALLLLKAELAAAPFLGVKTLYEPGPGVADLRDSIARDLMAWKAARSDGEAPRAELEPEAGMARLFEGGRVGTPRADLARSTRGFQELRASSVTATVTGCPRKMNEGRFHEWRPSGRSSIPNRLARHTARGAWSTMYQSINPHPGLSRESPTSASSRRESAAGTILTAIRRRWW